MNRYAVVFVGVAIVGQHLEAMEITRSPDIEKIRCSLRLVALAKRSCEEIEKLYPELTALREEIDTYNRICAEIAEKEIKNGADVNIVTSYEGYKGIFLSPIGWVANAPVFNRSLMEMLLKNGADTERSTPLIWAIRARNLEAVQMLIDAKAKVDSKLWDQSVLCHALIMISVNDEAKKEASKKIFTFLLEHGVDVNMKNEDGETSLFHAARYSMINEINELLAHGADVTITDKYNRKAVYYVEQALQNQESYKNNRDYCPFDETIPREIIKLLGGTTAKSSWCSIQ